MTEPTLAVMAAGMGSRFGGLKQITDVDGFGHAIIDYSLYDAKKAGFKKVAFIIKHDIEDDFKRSIGKRMEKYFDVSYVFQELQRLPEGYAVPQGRVKPWGTGHAVMCCAGTIDGPFAVINADDFYGSGAYKAMYDYLSEASDPDEYAMVAYKLKNTVTENGSVARGVCSLDGEFLTDIRERTNIVKRGDDAAFTEDGVNYTFLSGNTDVSMNFWGFSQKMLMELTARFPAFLDKGLADDPLKCEYFLPFVADEQLKEGVSRVKVLKCSETWYGMTYKEDLSSVKEAIAQMRKEGKYPEMLWE